MKDDKVLPKREAAELFNPEFANKFNFDTSATLLSSKTKKRDVLLSEFTCMQSGVLTAIISCLNTYSSPDGISYVLLKCISKFILLPLYITCNNHTFI